MFGLRKKSPANIQIYPLITDRVEIEVAKGANKEVKEKAKRVTSDVRDLLVQNGFTLTIALAASSPTIKRKGK